MSTFTFKIHGRNVKFKAASMTQALFARDHHLAHLRDKAQARAAAKRHVSGETMAFWRGVQRGVSNRLINPQTGVKGLTDFELLKGQKRSQAIAKLAVAVSARNAEILAS